MTQAGIGTDSDGETGNGESGNGESAARPSPRSGGGGGERWFLTPCPPYVREVLLYVRFMVTTVSFQSISSMTLMCRACVGCKFDRNSLLRFVGEAEKKKSVLAAIAPVLHNQ